jgi:hypothetical protein
MSELQKAAARENGKMGGRPTSALTDLRKKAREDAQKLLASMQVRAVNFLVKVMLDESVDVRERVKCATELLDRGEMPKKSAAYHGVGEIGELDAIFAAPKLFSVSKFGAETIDETRVAS